jgi:hypothetical protein
MKLAVGTMLIIEAVKKNHEIKKKSCQNIEEYEIPWHSLNKNKQTNNSGSSTECTKIILRLYDKIKNALF